MNTTGEVMAMSDRVARSREIAAATSVIPDQRHAYRRRAHREVVTCGRVLPFHSWLAAERDISADGEQEHDGDDRSQQNSDAHHPDERNDVPLSVESSTPTANPCDERLAALREAIDRVFTVATDELSEPDLDTEVAALENAIRRLTARQTRVVAAIADRRSQSARDANPQAPAAGEQARRDLQDELSDRMQWTKSHTKQLTEAGRELNRNPGSDTSAAFDAGALSPRHLRLITSTLKHLDGEVRERAEQTLTAAAKGEDAVTFGRTCRRLLAQLDHDAAMREERRRFDRRSARMATTEDGMLRISAELSGLDAETVATAIQAFRQPDPAETPFADRRRPEQVTADALVEVCRSAVRAGEAPTDHGVRPHVVVTIDWETLAARQGAAELGKIGTVPFGEVRRVLTDAGVARILVDAESLPMETSAGVRTVPTGLWRALVHRDGGCIARGCDAPASWTDVMHVVTPHAEMGRLTLDNTALGCRRHHRKFDLGTWQVTWQNGRPELHPP